MSTMTSEQTTTQQDSGGSLLAQDTVPVSEATSDIAGVQENVVEHVPQSDPIGKWRDSLPADLKEDPSLQKFMNVDDLAKSYIHAQKMIGADKIVVPSKHATDDDWKVLFHKLGQPQAMEEYQLTVPQDAKFDDGFISQFKEQAFKNNILPHQAQKMIEWYNEANNAAIKDSEAAHERMRVDVSNQLKQEFGQAFDVKMREARRGLEGLTGKAGLDLDSVWSWVESAGVGDDPQFIKLMAALGGMFGEDTVMTGAVKQGAITPDQASKQLEEIYGNLEHPYFIKGHPGNKSAVEEVTRLMEAKLAQGS